MSVGPFGGIAGSAAGAPLAQTKGSEVERLQQDAGAQQRRVQGQLKAETAAGIGQADGEDHQTDERDADGRRLWERPAQKPGDPPADDSAAAERLQCKDPTGQSGNLLDLSG
jgi:hypothetical protein